MHVPEHVAARVCQRLALLSGDDGGDLLLVAADERLVPGGIVKLHEHLYK